MAEAPERQVRRIEKREGMTFESLRRLAAAHGLDLKKYLDEVTKMRNPSDLSRSRFGSTLLTRIVKGNTGNAMS